MLRLDRNQQQPFLLACSKTIERVAATHPNSEKLSALISLYKKVATLDLNNQEGINVEAEVKVFNQLLTDNTIERDVDLFNFLFQFRYSLWLPEKERYALRDAMALRDLAEILEDRDYLNSILTSPEWFSEKFKNFLNCHQKLTTLEAMKCFLETHQFEELLADNSFNRPLIAYADSFRVQGEITVAELKSNLQQHQSLALPTILIATAIHVLENIYREQEHDFNRFMPPEKSMTTDEIPFTSGRVLSLLEHSDMLSQIALGQTTFQAFVKNNKKDKEDVVSVASSKKFRKYGRNSYIKFKTTPRDENLFEKDRTPILETLYHFLSSPNDMSLDEFLNNDDMQNKVEMSCEHFSHDKNETFVVVNMNNVNIPLECMKGCVTPYTLELTFQIKRDADNKEYYELIHLWTDEGRICDEWEAIDKCKHRYLNEVKSFTDNAARNTIEERYRSAQSLLQDIKSAFPDLRKKIHDVIIEVDKLYRAPLASDKTKEELVRTLQNTTNILLQSDTPLKREYSDSCTAYQRSMTAIKKMAGADRLYSVMSVLLATIAIAGCIVAGVFTFGIGAVIAGGLFVGAVGASASVNRIAASYRLFKLHKTMNDLNTMLPSPKRINNSSSSSNSN